jgi:outer membrane protein assembly factor BamB
VKTLPKLSFPAIVTALMLAASAPLQALPEKWASFGGPTGEFLVEGLPETMNEDLEPLWSYPIKGQSYGPISADESLVLVPDHGDGMDYFYALDPATGEELWVHEMESSGDMDYGASPRTVPLFHEGKIYILNAWGVLHVLDREDGSVVWEKNLPEDFDAELPVWGYCSPMFLIEEGLVTNPGGSKAGLVCLNPENGEVVWTAEASAPNYAAPLHAEFGGQRQFMFYDDDGLRSVDPATGEELWLLEVYASSGYICPAPVKLGDDRLLLVDQDNGARIYNMVDGKPEEEPAVESYDIYSELTTPFMLDDQVYFFYYELLRANPEDLEITWRNSDYDAFAATPFGYPLLDQENKRMLFYTGTGDLFMIDLSGEEPEVTQQAKITEKSEACPALIGNMLYARDDVDSVYAYKLFE